MKKTILKALVVYGVFLTTLAAINVQAVEVLTKEDFVQKTVMTKHLVKTADNAVFLFDGSDSMSKKFMDTGMSRYEVAKKVFKERNSYFPDLGHNFGLYLYTPWEPVYPLQPYDREAFAAALDSLPAEPRGPTMLQGALRKLDSLLAGLSGTTVVFIITDGTYTDVGSPRPGDPKGEPRPGIRPSLLAKKLAEKYDVCFCVISTADDRKSREVIDRIGSSSMCSTAVPFETYVTRPEYNTGLLYIVEPRMNVQTVTETRIVGANVDNVAFEFNSASISRSMTRTLDNLGRFLQDNPEAYVVLAGHTCSIGGKNVNLKLSKRRAQSAARYLEDNFDITSDRLVTLWYGKKNPVADNSTEEGRQMNRRVEFAVGMAD